MFDRNGNYTGKPITRRTIAKMPSSGPCDEFIASLRRKRKFYLGLWPDVYSVARNYLVEEVGIEESEVSNMTETQVSDFLLWMACCEVRESGSFSGFDWSFQIDRKRP